MNMNEELINLLHSKAVSTMGDENPNRVELQKALVKAIHWLNDEHHQYDVIRTRELIVKLTDTTYPGNLLTTPEPETPKAHSRRTTGKTVTMEFKSAADARAFNEANSLAKD